LVLRQATRVEIDEERIEDFREKILKDGEFDAYCLDCCKESHFKGHLHSRFNFARTPGTDPLLSIENGNFYHEFKCTRNLANKLIFYFQTKDKFLLKIGQSPSMADLQLFDIKKYKHYLPTIVI
jgi:hypothetical protein